MLPPVTTSRQVLWGQLGSTPLVLGAHSASSLGHTPLVPRPFHVAAIFLCHIFSSTLAFGKTSVSLYITKPSFAYFPVSKFKSLDPTSLTVQPRQNKNTVLKTLGFPGGSVIKNPPVNAGDMGSVPDPGRSHMPWSNEARVPHH